MRSRSFLALVTALLALVTPTRARAQATDVIRGRVTSDSGALADVSVSVTSIAGNVTRTARTDSRGRFTITFPGGEGDYMVSFAAIGYAAKRFEVKRIADEDVLLADAKLTRVGAVLEAMKVTATRDKVRRNDPVPDVSGTEQSVDNSQLPAASLGDLAAMAASLPGVQLVPGEDGGQNGFSVLGLGSDQNNTTLNGMQFGGAGLPRDAAVSSSLITSPYDVSRGGFSGGQFSLRSRSGSNFQSRGMSLNLDAPQMQWTDRASRALGQEYSNVSLGGMASGPIVFDKAFYNVAYQLGRRSSDLQSLLNTDPAGLQAAGVSADSVERLLGILSTEQIPTIGRRPLDDKLGDQGSLFGSVDIAPPSSISGQSFNVAFNGSWNRQLPVSSTATEVPAFGGERTDWSGGIQGRNSGYIHGLLSESTLGVNASRNWSSPFLWLPAGRVRVNSDFPDGGNGVQTLSFGGSQNLNTSLTNNTIGGLNQLSWFSTNNKHRLKLTSELRREAYTQDQTTNVLGTFTYNSLTDLESDRPASYTRQLSPRVRDGSQLVGALALGDSYRKSPDFQMQYGLRLDANRYLSSPEYNPAIMTTFGVRNDVVPSRVYVSPRLGFSWIYGKAPQVSSFEGAMRVPRAVVRGGVGLFQNMPQTSLIGGAIDNTGLPSAVQQLTCVGSATPTPDWDAYAADPSSIPDRCADGSTGSVFANSAPNVSLFDKDWKASRSARGNLQWSGATLGNRFQTTIDATYSMNLNQSGPIDLNFSGIQRFALANEDNRPVFVQPSSIVPATGAIASRDARISNSFARVTESRSDLRSESKQVRLSFSPVRFSTKYSWNVSYVYGNVRERTRGFGGTTISNPMLTEWGRASFDSRHQFVYNLGYNFFDAVRVSWFGQIRSGTPFTPVVAGDINGDGWSNDRAFVFDPATASDATLSSSMQSLLANGSSVAQKCLRSQIGHLAARNSCQSPWTSNGSLSISFNPVKVRMPQRTTISFQLSNPLGAADLLFHGSDNLRGWGQPSFPDRNLLYVRGFDPATQQYRYEVNQRFGKTNTALAAIRQPVTLTAMIRFDVGPTRERQTLTQQLDRGRTREGDKLPEPFMRAMFANGGGLPNPLATILRQQDTLHLTAMQADSIATLNRWYVIRLDSIWSPVAKYLAALPNNYDRDEAYDRYMKARHGTVDLLARLSPTVKHLLTSDQRRKLPTFITNYLEPRYLASIRSGTGGFNGGMFFPGMMGGFGGPGGGGGGQTVIIRQ